jgi:hypothetical protein
VRHSSQHTQLHLYINRKIWILAYHNKTGQSGLTMETASDLHAPPDRGDESHQKLTNDLWNASVHFVENKSMAAIELVNNLLSYTKQHENSREDWELYFKSLAFTITWLVKQLPHDNSNHDRIITAVLQMQKQSQPLENERQGLFLYCMFDMFGFSLWTSPLDPPFSERDTVYMSNRPVAQLRQGPPSDCRLTTSPQEWTNLNSYYARLMSVMTPGTGTHALHLHEVAYFHVLRTESTAIIADALEYDNEANLMDKILPAACCWILFAGALYRRVSWDPDGQFKPSSGREIINPGPQYSGKGLISVDRWNYWRERLLELTQDDSLSECARRWTANASKAMMEIEVNVPTTELEPLFPPGFSLNRPLSPG